MEQTVRCIWEHNGADTLLHLEEHPGAYARGASLDEAAEKISVELFAYLRWRGVRCETAPEARPVIVQEVRSALCIRDADSGALFDSERTPLTMEEYSRLSALAMRSAHDFQALYDAIPSKRISALPQRMCFYGPAPRTAQQMYAHVRDVNAYFFDRIGAAADNAGSIADCRARGFAALEKQKEFLKNGVYTDGYGEQWTLRKLCRRFVFHDRIHARAMTRMAAATFGPGSARDVFFFSLLEGQGKADRP